MLWLGAAGLCVILTASVPAAAEALQDGAFEPRPYTILFTEDGTPYTPPSNLMIVNDLAVAMRNGELPSTVAPQAPQGPPPETREVAPAPEISAGQPGTVGKPPGALYQEPGSSVTTPARRAPEAPQTAQAPVEAPEARQPREYQDGIYVIKSSYLESWLDNSWRIVSGPARYDEGDWMNVALVAGLTGGLMIADTTIRDFWQDDVRSGTTDDIGDFLYHFGDLDNLLLGSLGAYAVAETFSAKREKAAALMAFESVLLSALITKGIQLGTGRERPNSTDDAFNFTGPIGTGEFDSFSSGHATHAFALASVLSEVYGDDNPWVPWVAYPIAASVGLARINGNKHWASDVVLGSAIGLFVGKMVTRFNPFLKEHGVEIQAFNQSGAQGVAFNIPF
jgi:membrane-associated phospholipid phosphatase